MSSDEFEFLDDDVALLSELDAIESHYKENGLTALPPRTAVNRPGMVQRDLFGGNVVSKPVPPPQQQGKARTVTLGGGGGGGGLVGETKAKTRISKEWDRASFARHGWSKKNAAVAKAKAKGGKGKGKAKSYGSDEEPWDEEEVLDDDDDEDGDGEDFLIDTTYDPKAPILPIKWPPDPEASKTFVYPVQADKPLRVYQYNIVQSALYKNSLVSLPTGLGKTFIAACVMLNFYRWYPRGKVLFLAPTRPLVAQQVKACHYIAGIPQSDCIELTGGTQPKLRSLGWATKRVIYSTPQTVERDLAKGRLDPRDVTLVVVDEAHRASGDYSYCGVIRYMMCRNPHFRVLALTATPGARGEAVQEVIDNLHIGHIEVRADDSIDIRQYIHKKSFDLTVLPLGPALSALRDKWADLMKPYIGPLLNARLLWSGDAAMLAPFAVQQAYGKINSLPGGGKANGKFFPMIKTLQQMCRAMEYLVIQSVTSFESSLKDIQANGAKSLINQPGFKQVLSEVNNLRSRAGYVGHPKMEKLRSMCIEHFKSTANEVDEYTGEKRETRVMIFCNFRAVVEEIVDCLNTQRPLIKATPFVGQASSKGSKGKSQKEQLETIKKFKKGVYNVLVATSIGEEGLDIGEIDLIVCYEANKSPIRMLQRVGRTGRARDGHIIVLMSEGREERNWDKANDAYNEVQNALTSNKIFDLYGDCERLLPADVKPVCEKVQIKAQPLDLEAMTMKGHSKAERKHLAEEKKNRKPRDPKANMPNDAFDGFRTAGQLAAASKVKAPRASQTLRERKADALLTTEEDGDLRARWLIGPSGEPVRPQRFATEDLPFVRGSSGSAHRINRHSQRHLDLLAALRVTDQLSDSKPQSLDAWHDKLSNAFNAKYVDVFKREDDDPPPPKHTRLRRPSISEDEEDDLAVAFPALTGYPMTQRHLPSSLPTVAEDDRPLFRAPSPTFGSSLPFPSSSKRPRTTSSPRPESPKRARLADAATKTRNDAPPSRTKAVDDSFALDMIDLSFDLSSDDEILRPPKPPSPITRSPVARQGPSSTSFSNGFDDDDDVMVWSESELLKGAIIRGKSVSKSPPKIESVRPAAPPAAIVLDDSEDEDVRIEAERIQDRPPQAPRKPLVPTTLRAKPAGTGPLPSRTTSVPSLSSTRQDVAPTPPPRPKSVGAVGFRPFVPPRLSGGSQPKSSPAAMAKPAQVAQDLPRSSPASVTVAGAEEEEDDEYSFFDLPPAVFDDVGLSQLPAAAIRGRPADMARSRNVIEQEQDDSIIMPPPPPSVSRPKPSSSRPIASRPLPPNPKSTSNPTRRIVAPSPDQSLSMADDEPSSDPVVPNFRTNGGFKPAKSLLPPDINIVSSRTPSTSMSGSRAATQTRMANQAPMRRMAVPDSSSPAVDRARQQNNAVNQEESDHASFDQSTSSIRPKVLSRLRRGGAVVVDSDDDDQGALDNSSPPPVVKVKKTKKKKPLLTHKIAARMGIFDNEAINSSASGSEASSEDYDSENSIDRDFVAGDDEVDEGEEGTTFYRDSLATQVPGGGRGPVFATEPDWMRKRKMWAQPDKWDAVRIANEEKAKARGKKRTPATPRSEASQFSYDSFCVDDDEPIVFDDSQELGTSSQI